MLNTPDLPAIEVMIGQVLYTIEGYHDIDEAGSAITRLYKDYWEGGSIYWETAVPGRLTGAGLDKIRLDIERHRSTLAWTEIRSAA